MNALWEGVKATAGIVGQAAVETGMKGKLQAELLLISNEIENRKRAFGEELYEYVVSHSQVRHIQQSLYLLDIPTHATCGRCSNCCLRSSLLSLY